MFVAVTIKREWADEVIWKVEGPFNDFDQALRYKEGIGRYYKAKYPVAHGHDGMVVNIIKIDTPEFVNAASVAE